MPTHTISSILTKYRFISYVNKFFFLGSLQVLSFPEMITSLTHSCSFEDWMGGTGSSAGGDGWNSAGPSSERYVSGYQCISLI